MPVRVWLRAPNPHGGTEGLKQFVATNPSIVILDIGMPELDGYEVARKIRSGVGKDSFLVA